MDRARYDIRICISRFPLFTPGAPISALRRNFLSRMCIQVSRAGVVDPEMLFSILYHPRVHCTSSVPISLPKWPGPSVDRVLASRLHYRLYCINHPHSPREAGKTMVEDPTQSFSLLSYSLIVGSVYLRRAVLSFELYKHVPLHDRCCLSDATLKTESIRKMNRSARAAPLSISLFLFLSLASLPAARYFFRVVHAH